jgi:hypothetical protein
MAHKVGYLPRPRVQSPIPPKKEKEEKNRTGGGGVSKKGRKRKRIGGKGGGRLYNNGHPIFLGRKCF